MIKKRLLCIVFTICMTFQLFPILSHAQISQETWEICDTVEEYAILSSIAVTIVPDKTEYSVNQEILDVTD